MCFFPFLLQNGALDAKSTVSIVSLLDRLFNIAADAWLHSGIGSLTGPAAACMTASITPARPVSGGVTTLHSAREEET